MIVSEHKQNTKEWKLDRLGCPSSSCFGRIVSAKGIRSKSREKYMAELAAELITGEFTKGFHNKDMDLGHEREQENIDTYAFKNGVTVESVGFCWEDEKKLYGASPDSLVDDDGLVEAKNSNGAQQIDRILNGWTASEHHRQAMGQMLVTGRQWCDVVSMCRGMQQVVVRFNRDEAFLKILKVELIMFHRELHELVKRVQQ